MDSLSPSLKRAYWILVACGFLGLGVAALWIPVQAGIALLILAIGFLQSFFTGFCPLWRILQLWGARGGTRCLVEALQEVGMQRMHCCMVPEEPERDLNDSKSKDTAG